MYGAPLIFWSILNWIAPIIPIVLIVWLIFKINSIHKTLKEISNKLDK